MSSALLDDSMNGGASDDEGLGMFDEPKDFRPSTPPPTQASYVLQSRPPYTVRMSLVGSHPLWAHHLWNAAPTLSDYLTENGLTLCKGKAVLELGAGAGLPSIVAHRLGARLSVTTDYPDADLIGNLQCNADANRIDDSLVVEGFIWGSDAAKLRTRMGKDDAQRRFDVLLLSDLIFNHQAHAAMLDTLDTCLPGAENERVCDVDARPQALVFFTHHRPHLADKDMGFFDQARLRGWTCEQIGQWKMKPMFPEDPGSEEVRGTVHGWRVYR